LEQEGGYLYLSTALSTTLFSIPLAPAFMLRDSGIIMAELIRLASVNEAEPQRLPRNVEAEAAFLGALLIDNRIIEDVSLKLHPDHFLNHCTARFSNRSAS
jgi:hypothetical protein